MNKILAHVVLSSVIALPMFSPANAAKVESGQYLPSVMPNTNVKYWKPYPLDSGVKIAIKHSEPQLRGSDAFYIDSTQNVADQAFFIRNVNVINGDKLEIEAKVKLESQIGDSGCFGSGLAIEDDKNSEALQIHYGIIIMTQSRVSYAMNTTDKYHVYRMVAQGNNVKVYVDGGKSPVIDAAFTPPNWTPEKYLGFGDGSVCAGASSFWAYVKYKVTQVVPR